MEREFEHRLTEVEGRSKSNQHRLDEVEKRQDNLDNIVNTVSRLDEREKRVETDVKEIKTDVKNLTSIPAKRWEGLITQVITLIVAAIAGFVLAKIGL